ncbi:UDP-N-acetylglucosamine 2-epimerase (non-hydrolyzing) [Emcibacteraceae bacterium]|nr:UDP-N-acetylglucosamine 2-epimerase (non-hydrolyzing) [Emcibacteraceae bacterium]
MKIVTVVGARPQFIKAAVISSEFEKIENVEEVIIHTGQHYDSKMSDIFFKEMGIPEPKYFLSINNASHGKMTGNMLIEIEKILVNEKPDLVLLYGDTNSTLAGALAAVKLKIKIAHVESGLRNHDLTIPEEVNRIFADSVSNIVFYPTDLALQNLIEEGYDKKNDALLVRSGDIMEDAAYLFKEHMVWPSNLPINVDDEFVLATLHRAGNTDDADRLKNIVEGINRIHAVTPVVLPIHPRTAKRLTELNIQLDAHIIEPIGYFEMLSLLDKCQLVLTDSGGVQKESYFFNKVSLIFAEYSPWKELVEAGFNVLVDDNSELIYNAFVANKGRKVEKTDNFYGGGEARHVIIGSIQAYLKDKTC